MLMGSMVILFAILVGVKYRIRLNNKPKSNITISTPNLANKTMTEFLSFFLLPFFTFNIHPSNSVTQQVIELSFILALLTIFLYRSENLLINPFIFLFFNMYKGTSPGNDYSIIMPKHRIVQVNDTLSKDNFIRVTNKIILYSSNEYDIKLINSTFAA